MEEKRTDHSRNPEKSYEIIEGMYPEAKKIEIFAKFVYPDWTGIGLEAQPKKYTKFEEKCIHFDMFLSCYTEEEIAKEIGIPQQTVHDAIKCLPIVPKW